jgi:DNA-binding cell septation regulator SpoVG
MIANCTHFRLATNPSSSDLVAFASVTVADQVAIHNIRVLSVDGLLMIAMPSTKHQSRCPQCDRLNDFNALYCNGCACELSVVPVERRYSDIAHPTNGLTRRAIESVIFTAYDRAQNRNAKTRLNSSSVCPIDFSKT